MDDIRHADAHSMPLQGPHRPLEPAEALPADFLPLRLIQQPAGTTIELTVPDMVVGRHSEADVRLPMPDVSRRHCRFVFGNGNWVVMDLNSLNGVYVNDEPVGQATLTQGDRVKIGSFVFAVDLSHEVLPMPQVEAKLAQNIFNIRRTPTTYTPQRRAS
jgi:pSer/pThr/pTyr-binding forkhead associated (FHA) protein